MYVAPHVPGSWFSAGIYTLFTNKITLLPNQSYYVEAADKCTKSFDLTK